MARKRKEKNAIHILKCLSKRNAPPLQTANQREIRSKRILTLSRSNKELTRLQRAERTETNSITKYNLHKSWNPSNPRFLVNFPQHFGEEGGMSVV